MLSGSDRGLVMRSGVNAYCPLETGKFCDGASENQKFRSVHLPRAGRFLHAGLRVGSRAYCCMGGSVNNLTND